MEKRIKVTMVLLGSDRLTAMIDLPLFITIITFTPSFMLRINILNIHQCTQTQRKRILKIIANRLDPLLRKVG